MSNLALTETESAANAQIEDYMSQFRAHYVREQEPELDEALFRFVSERVWRCIRLQDALISLDKEARYLRNNRWELH